MSDCLDYGVKTTLPIVCLFDTASNAFLASTRGEGGAGEQFDSALRNQFQELGNTLSDLLRSKAGNIETNQRLKPITANRTSPNHLRGYFDSLMNIKVISLTSREKSRLWTRAQ
jgi:hypothetical protein